MPDTQTPTINLTKPEIGASRDAWGNKWNANADTLDAAIKADRASIKANTDAIAGLKLVPAGMMGYFAMVTPPTGWLKANGASLSRATYPDLFAAIGTQYGAVDANSFNLPDIRGYFFRPLDDGRGIDAGRVIGSIQADQNVNHGHGSIGPYTRAGDGNPNYWVPFDPGAGYLPLQNITQTVASSGGNEARPKNIAFPVFIKF